MESLVPLGILAATSAGLLTARRMTKKEGFAVSPFSPGGQQLIREGSEKYNPLMNLIAPTRNPLVPPNFTQGQLAQAQTSARQALQTNQAYPDDPSFTIKAGATQEYKINPESQGTAFYDIKVCEAVATPDCSAFDKPGFAKTCGICFEDGYDSQGAGKLGGLYINEDDKQATEENSKKLGSRNVKYAPSTGSCKPGRFATTKAECQRIQRVIECEKKQNFDVPGCSQCTQDDVFRYIDPSLQKSTASLFLAGEGTASILRYGQKDPIELTLSSSPTQVPIQGLHEGDTIEIQVEGPFSGLAGYLSGNTPTGAYTTDISRLIPTDTRTGTKPRMGGSLQVGDTSYMLMRPGRYANGMTLILTNPFTFIEPREEEAGQCAGGPYVMTARSAQILNSSPCYKKGQAPGSYSQECMQTLYESSGCSADGKAYPGSQQASLKLQFDARGNAMQLGGISNFLYQLYNQATTGKNDQGQPLQIDEWNTKSMDCLGKQITSVCDKYDRATGPLGADCLSYLWQNAGEKETTPGGVSNTYSSTQAIASLGGKNINTYCRTSGTMAPIDANGKENAAAIRAAQAKGGVEAVKAFYDQISRTANDNSKKDKEREQAIQQCYGISLQAYQEQQSASGKQVALKSVLDSNSGSTKTMFKPDISNTCFVYTPTGQPADDSTPLKPYYMTKPILILNNTPTGKINLFSNMNNIQAGTVVKIGYLKTGSVAPESFKVIVTNQYQGTSREGVIVTIPNGFMATITTQSFIAEPWYSRDDQYSATLDTLDKNPGCARGLELVDDPPAFVKYQKAGFAVYSTQSQTGLDDSTPLRPMYGQPILILNDKATRGINLFSNMPVAIGAGTSIRIGYKKQSATAPSSFKIVVTNQYQNTANEETIVSIPDGQLATITIPNTIGNVWYSRASNYTASLSALPF